MSYLIAIYFEPIVMLIDNKCFGIPPWKLIFASISSTIILIISWNFIFKKDKGVFERLKLTTFQLIKSIPFIKNKINKEIYKEYIKMEKSFHESAKNTPYIKEIPAKGLSDADVMNEIKKYKDLSEIKWNEGACSGSVYSGEENLTKLMTKVYSDFAWTNPLHADVFPDVRKMEAEVVRMSLSLFNGDYQSCGTMTSGGSESLLLACYAYRNIAYSKGIEYPEIILPTSAHAAFNKAAHMFQMKLVHVDIDENSKRVNIQSMKKSINSNTCMLVGSAPQFPYGVIDDITKISELGEKYKVPVHVDCCLGGFLVPFMKKAGFNVQTFDFTLDGVTSISADTHKYGLAPKGSSVILYRSKGLRQFQYFVATDWPGGIYASPTFAGSRAGALIAACWATMLYTGMDGYINTTKNIINTTRHIHEKLKDIDGLELLEPETSVITIMSSKFNIYRLSDELVKKGWCLNPLQFPPALHMCLTSVHTKPGVADNFISDVRICTRRIMQDPNAKLGGQAAMYGLAQSIPDRSLVAAMANSYFDAYYSTDIKQEESKYEN